MSGNVVGDRKAAESELAARVQAVLSWKILARNRTFTAFNPEVEKAWAGPFYFIQGADIQFGLIQRYIEKNPVPGWSKEVDLANRTVQKINEMKPRPRFFVICGDLVDAFSDQEPDINKQQEATFKEAFQKLSPEIPLVCVCGNHDIGDHPTVESVRTYKSQFGDDFFSFWCGGVYFLVINSQYYFDTEKVQNLAEEYYTWLDKQLAEIRSIKPKRVIIFQHIPWFLKSADEKDSSYFAISYEIRQKMLRQFLSAGVTHVFCGHYHRNAGGYYEDLEVVVTSAIGGQLGDDLSGVRVVQVLDDKVQHKYYDIDSIPANIAL